MRQNVLNDMKDKLKAGLPDEMLFDFMYKEYKNRCAERDFWKAPTLEKWEKERAKLKEIFHDMFSPFPEKTPLNLQVTASYQRDGYRMDCVTYDTAPGVTATANLYVPDGAEKGKTPAVIVACGHAEDAKSFYRFVSEEMAKAGMVSLCFDPSGQGERFETWNFLRWQARGNNDHDRIGALSLLMGGNMAGIFAWDCMRAVDCVLACPETDPSRIGFTGTSGGGTQTTWAATLDERIAVAAPSCFITSIDDLLLSRDPTDCEQNPPGLLAHGLEFRDFLAMMAPKPVLVLATEKDFFPIQGAKDTVESLKKLYACYGCEEKAEISIMPGGHAGRGHMATRGLMWFKRWFGMPYEATTPEDCAEKDAAFAACPKVDEDTFAAEGQAIFGKTLSNYWTYYAKCIRELPHTPVDKEKLTKTLAIVDVKAPIALDQRFEGQLTGGILNSEDGISIPYIYARADREKQSKKLCVLSHEDGMIGAFGNAREAELLLKNGVDVLAFDPRGVGVTRGGSFGWWSSEAKTHLYALHAHGAFRFHNIGQNDPGYEGYYATSHEIGMHGLKLGRPVVGQRVTDTLRVLSAIGEITKRNDYEVSVYGAGYSAVWMLYAAILTDVKLEKCAFHSIIASFRLLAQYPEHRYYHENIVRGILPVADIPEALSALPCPAFVVDPMDSLCYPLEKMLAEEYLGASTAERFYTGGETNPLYTAVEYLSK